MTSRVLQNAAVDWLESQRGWIARIYWFIQRGRRGYATCDVWSLDGYLARWMPDALREIKGTGHPGNMTPQEWDARLETMALGFEEYGNEKMWDQSKEAKKRARQGLKVFGKYFGHLWW